MVTRIEIRLSEKQLLSLELRCVDKETHSFFSDHPKKWQEVIQRIREVLWHENPDCV